MPSAGQSVYAVSAIDQLNDRVRALTGGYIPDDEDGSEILHREAIFIIQRHPERLCQHRVARLGSTISVEHLRSLVCAGWRPDEISP